MAWYGATRGTCPSIKTTINGEGFDHRVISQVKNGLLNYLPCRIDIAHLDGGKTQGKRKAACGGPKPPRF